MPKVDDLVISQKACHCEPPTRKAYAPEGEAKQSPISYVIVFIRLLRAKALAMTPVHASYECVKVDK